MVPSDHQRHVSADVGGPFEDRGDVPVVVAAQLDDALLDAVGLQPVPPAEAMAARALLGLPGDGFNPGAADRQHPGVPPAGDRDQVVRASLDRREQRPDVRPCREDGTSRENAWQRQRLEQAKLLAGEERDCVAEPVPSVCGQCAEDGITVGVTGPGDARAVRSAGSGAGHQVLCLGGQAPHAGRVQRHRQVQRQHGRFRRAHAP